MIRRWRPTTGRRFRSDEDGVAAVEFSLLAFPFFFTIFALVEIGLVFIGELTLDNAVDRIGRDLRTGQVQAQAPSREEFRDMVCEKVSFLLDCDKLDVDLSVYETFAAIQPTKPEEMGFDLGRGGQIMALRVYYDWPMITHVLRAAVKGPDGSHRMTGMAAFQTELF